MSGRPFEVEVSVSAQALLSRQGITQQSIEQRVKIAMLRSYRNRTRSQRPSLGTFFILVTDDPTRLAVMTAGDCFTADIQLHRDSFRLHCFKHVERLNREPIPLQVIRSPSRPVQSIKALVAALAMFWTAS